MITGTVNRLELSTFLISKSHPTDSESKKALNKLYYTFTINSLICEIKEKDKSIGLLKKKIEQN